MKIGKRSALILVDVQNDFCPGGALSVPGGDAVVPVLNKYMDLIAKAGGPIFATRDWHPENHLSFKAQGGIWPPHCVQGTRGAEFHQDLLLSQDVVIISKGSDSYEEAYSGFQGTGLSERLKRGGIRRLFIGGLATDYCVKSTVLDAIREGFETIFLKDGSKGVEVSEGDAAMAIAEMRKAGAHAICLKDLRAD